MPYVTVHVELDDFDDDDIRDEYESRNLGSDDYGFTDNEVLTKAWMADREGRKEEAYVLLREYMLDKLNKVV
jgi:hypothetical protein